MKLAMVIYLFMSLFGAGFAFLWLNCHFAGRKFVFSLKKAAASVWLSVLFSVLSGIVHHQGMLIGEHLIFDAAGSLFAAVMLSCGIALAKERSFCRRRKAPCQNIVRHRQSNVIPFPQREHSTPVSRRKATRIAV